MKNLIMVLSLLLSFSLFAADKGLTVNVELSPAGDFQITTTKVKGKLKHKDGMYTSDKIYIKVNDMKTGIDLRDDHMKKRLLTKDKNSKKITVSKVKAKGGKGIGIIQIKGMKKKFKFTYTTAGKILTAKFKVNLESFKIKDLKYLGVGAKKIVDITANIPFK